MGYFGGILSGKTSNFGVFWGLGGENAPILGLHFGLKSTLKGFKGALKGFNGVLGGLNGD